jgi:DNA-directed RNA polymerase subunit RPC12/RpoP
VAEAPAPEGRYDVVCPHCRKPFTAEVLTGATERHQGFKCPHCRLFVPFERVAAQGETDPTR